MCQKVIFLIQNGTSFRRIIDPHYIKIICVARDRGHELLILSLTELY